MAVWHNVHFENYFNINGKNKNGITMHQFNILSKIYYAQINTISSLENVFGISKSSLSITVKKLENDGYILKKNGIDEDDRKVYLEVTDKGIEEIKIKEKIMYELFKNFFNSLSEENKENLQDGIVKFNKVFKSNIKITPKRLSQED